MKSFLIRGHLATAAVMAGVALTPSQALADVADDTYDPGQVEDSGADDDSDSDSDDDGCGSDATTGASLGLGLLALVGLKRRWD